MKFPKIDLPCPLHFNALPTAGKDFCTHCERKVHNLSGMTEVQRRQFLASCSGKVCVAYSVPHSRPVKAMRMGLGMLAAMVAMVAVPAVADSPLAPAGTAPMSPAMEHAGVLPVDDDEPECADALDATRREELEVILVMGGVSDPQNPRWLDADGVVGQIPTVSESAFLDGDGAEFVAAPGDSSP